MTNRCLIMLALIWLAGCAPQSPSRGTTSSGGGDIVAMEFKLTARSLARELLLRKPAGYEAFEPERMEAMAESCRVEAVETPLYAKGLPVSALNLPSQKLVQVRTSRWFSANASERERLVAHEIFGLLELDDHDYHLTEALIRVLGRQISVTFTSILIRGPPAASFVRHVKWSEFSFVGYELEKPNGGIQEAGVQINDGGHLDYFCQVPGADWELYNRYSRVPTDADLAGAYCVLDENGEIPEGSTAVIPVRDERSERLWKALGGTETKGFHYPSIEGRFRPKEPHPRTIRIELGSIVVR